MLSRSFFPPSSLLSQFPLSSVFHYRRVALLPGHFLFSRAFGTTPWTGRFLPFEESREYVRQLNLESQHEWKVWTVSGARPAHIPSNPWTTYKERGWIGIEDWLGYEKALPKFRDRDFVAELEKKRESMTASCLSPLRVASQGRSIFLDFMKPVMEQLKFKQLDSHASVQFLFRPRRLQVPTWAYLNVRTGSAKGLQKLVQKANVDEIMRAGGGALAACRLRGLAQTRTAGKPPPPLPGRGGARRGRED